MRRSVLLMIFLPILSIAATGQKSAQQATTLGAWTIHWQPAQIVNGAPVLFQVKPPTRLKSLTGSWLWHDVLFTWDPANKMWYGLAGTSLETKPGTFPLTLVAESEQGKPLSFLRKVRVGSAKYRLVRLVVPARYTEPNPTQMQEINQDKALKDKVFLQSAPEREWSGRFLPPVRARVSDVFGTRRQFNGAVQSVHQGLDYRVPAGTPVSAVNSGIVILAGPLFYEGKCVVLDHGLGLLTLYLHLSEIKVKEGDRVTRGQQIGLSGATGRATGAHLHIAVRWQGVYLNPSTLFALRFR